MSHSGSDKLVIAGGSGMLGRDLASSLAGDGADVVVLTRFVDCYGGPGRAVAWDGRSVGLWARELDGATAAVNFAGSPVNVRWTATNKRRVRESRLTSVRVLAEAIRRCAAPPSAWLQASAVGVYGEDRGDQTLTESSSVAPAGRDFLADVCRDWESAFDAAEVASRRVTLRIGVVLGRGGGAYPVLRRLTKTFLGGRAGDGRQWVPWIHQDDLTAAIRFLMSRPDLQGVFNLTAPNPATNADLMATLRQSLKRPPAPPAPAWALRAGHALLKLPTPVALASQRAVPARLTDAGFEFRFPTLDAALTDLA